MMSTFEEESQRFDYDDDEETQTKRRKTDDESEEDNVKDVLQYMDNVNVEKIAAKLFNVKTTTAEQQIPGVNYVATPAHLKDFINANREKKFAPGKFLNYFLNFIYERTCKHIDSSFSPLPDDKLNEILQTTEIIFPHFNKKNDFLIKSKAIQFSFNNFDYSLVVHCKVNRDAGPHNSITFDIVNPDSLKHRIETIIKFSIEKLRLMRNKWKQVLEVVKDDDVNRTDKYSAAAKSMKNELRGSLKSIHEHALFDQFMNSTEFDIEVGTLYMSATAGFRNPNNKFTCLELVDVEDEGTFLSKVDLESLDSDARMYASVRNFKLCYTDKHSCYLKGYVQWALKHDD